ncbi:MAG: hypothetical protein R2795_12090 [Saprospiraceae bacterium]
MALLAIATKQAQPNDTYSHTLDVQSEAVHPYLKLSNRSKTLSGAVA